MRIEFEKAFKKEYPHADYLACLKFDVAENQYKTLDEVEPPDVNFWVCVGVNTGWWSWQHQQSKVDELQADWNSLKDKNNVHQLMLRGIIATPDMQQCLHLHGEDALKRWNGIDDLKKQMGAVKTLIEEYRDPPTEDKTFQHALSIVADELEQALKGGGE